MVSGAMGSPCRSKKAVGGPQVVMGDGWEGGTSKNAAQPPVFPAPAACCIFGAFFKTAPPS